MLLSQLQDSTNQALTTAYDTVWSDVPTAAPTPLEGLMLPHDKIFVVLAVVLIIWGGLLFFMFRTDRKLDRLERELEDRIPSQS